MVVEPPGGDIAPDPLNALAAQHLGIAYLYPYQRLVISNLLEGRNQIVVLPTGSGKSVCFMFPAAVLQGVTLVVLPLLALLEDLYRRMTAAGLEVAVLRGGQSRSERAAALEWIGSRRARLVLTTPEAALGERLLAAMVAAATIEHLVVDEAHCISQWGDTFRPAYLRLGELVEALRPRLLTAFTATATPPVLRRMREVLFPDGGAHLVAGNPDRPNIRYAVAPTAAPLRRLTELVATCPRPLIMFARSRRGVEALCWQLRRRLPEVDCRFYHAGLNAAERKRLERWFLTSDDGALMATSAYGMGVDKPNIRTVVHQELPDSVEAYLQETGRAGRDGRASQAILLAYQPHGFPTAGAAAGTPAPHDAQRQLALRGYAANSATCRRAQLLRFFHREQEECAGCDVCDREVRPLPAVERRLLPVLRRGSRRYTLRQWRHILCGGRSPVVERDGLWRVAGFGMLANWHPEEVQEACAALLAAGLARVPARGPWRGRLIVRRPRRKSPPPLYARSVASATSARSFDTGPRASLQSAHFGPDK